MKHIIFTYMKSYQAKLDSSLSLRSQLDKHTKGSDNYQQVFNKMLNVELECQELDDKIYWELRKLKNKDIEFEYYNHIKYNQHK